MKKLDVLTAQNVTISYDLSSVVMRAIASIIDVIVVFIYTLILSSILGTTIRSIDEFETAVVWFYILAGPVMFFYSPICEKAFKGQTLGKKIVGIRVVQTNGEKPTLEQVLVRWAFRIVDLWMSFGAIAVLSSSASPKGQRLGDRIAGTSLIRTTPSTVYALNDVMNIKTQKNYKPQYTGVTQFSDEDMMLIKKSLSRLKKTPNKHYKELCYKLADQCAEKLNLPETPNKKGAFLKTLLNDYIVLTR